MQARIKQTVISGSLIVVMVIGLLIRLKDVTTPLADWHSWRQTDTASVSREYVKHGIDLLHPTYQDVSSIPSGKENPHGYRMVEFPIINAIVAWIYITFTPLQRFELHVVYRVIDVIFSLISALCLYGIIKRVESPTTGVIAAGIFLLIPYNIFYSRTVLPEVAMVMLALATVYWGVAYLDDGYPMQMLGMIIAGALALLVKPIAIFIIIALVPYWLSKQGIKKSLSWQTIAAALVMTIPLLLWRKWIQQYPEGIPASDWLLNGNGIRFKGAFFQWIFADRIGRLILGYYGILFAGLSVIAKKKSNLPMWLAIGSLAYVTIFATGNVQHDYYQIPIIPTIAILCAYGIQYLRHQSIAWYVKYATIAIVGISSIAFSWYHVRGLYQINNPAIVEAGKAVDVAAPKDALVIAPYEGDTAFLYQTNRQGWPIGGDIQKKIAAGATYYVSTSLNDETRQLLQTYQPIASTSSYYIVKLTK
jgi:hypothetical protein